MTLYELTQNAAYLQQLLADGVIDEQTFADTIESMMVEDKIQDVCKVIRNLEARASAFKEEAARLTAKQKAAENGVKKLKDRLTNFLQVTDAKKVESGLFTVSLRSSTVCEITDANQIPADYYTTPQPTVSTSAVKDALKQGIDVPGARLTQNPYVLIK